MNTEPTIICPKCQAEIKLTESLAAPIVESTREAYEKKLVQKDSEIATREKAIKEREEALACEKAAVDQKVQEKVKAERAKIVVEEAKKARIALGNDLDQKVQDLAELKDVLKQRDEKLAEAAEGPGRVDSQAARTGRRQARTRTHRGNASSGIAWKDAHSSEEGS
jgi:hypothetical protein